jgi:hypothetical protein
MLGTHLLPSKGHGLDNTGPMARKAPTQRGGKLGWPKISRHGPRQMPWLGKN